MQSIEFDPLINRYFEAEYTSQLSQSGQNNATNIIGLSGTDTHSVSHSNTIAEAATDSVTEEGETGKTLSGTSRDITSATSSKTGSLTESETGSKTDHSETTRDIDEVNGSTTNDTNTISQTVSGGTTSTSRDHGWNTSLNTIGDVGGSTTNSSRTGHREFSNESSEDNSGSGTDTHQTGNSTSETMNYGKVNTDRFKTDSHYVEKQGKEITHNEDEDHGWSNGISKRADKSAPMSAVNAGTSSYSGSDEHVDTRSTLLGDLNFTYASGYSQNDTYGKDDKESQSDGYTQFQNRKDVTVIDETRTLTDSGSDQKNVTSVGSDNVSHSATGHKEGENSGDEDTTETNVVGVTNNNTRTENLRSDHDSSVDGSTTDTHTTSGRDTKQSVLSGSKNIDESDETESTSQTTLAKTGATSETGSNSSTVTGATTGTEAGTSELTREGSSTRNVTNQGTSQDAVTRASTQNSSSVGHNSSTQNSVNRNRYTGREGLTPQAAIMEACDYLMGYSGAFVWLCQKLEPCFMGIYDI